MTPGQPHEDPAPPAQPQAQPAQVQTDLFVQDDEQGILGIASRQHPAQRLAGGGGVAMLFEFAVEDHPRRTPKK